jgi:TctA family transporter
MEAAVAALVQMLHLAATAEVGLVTEVAEAEMVHGMVLGTTVEQALADMLAMEQTLTVVVAVVITHLQVVVALAVVGTQALMVYRQAVEWEYMVKAQAV